MSLMNANTIRCPIVLSMCLALLSSCGLPPGEIDPSAIYHYQQRTLSVSPQARIEPLRPDPEAAPGPALELVEAPDGGRILRLTLDEAVYRALLNNLDIKVISFDPQISREQVVQAAAVFDTIVFAEGAFNLQDALSNSPFGASENTTYSTEMGLRQPLTTGGVVQLSHGLEVTDTNIATIFDPGWTQRMSLSLTQPLLRDGGEAFNLASLRIARANHETSLAAFRAQVFDVVVQVQTLYWQLVRGRQELAIQQRLLDRTVDTYVQVWLRRDLDATGVQTAQAQAAIEARRAQLVRAEKTVRDIQDQLVRVMADPAVTLLDDDVEVEPATDPSRAALTIDPAEQIALALRHSPELAQARLSVLANDIQVRVARNQLLPQLDLAAGVTFTGLDHDISSSWREMVNHDYISYNAALEFEYPIANRAARASLNEARLNRDRAVTVVQNTTDEIAQQIRQAVRQVETTHTEMMVQAAAVQANREYLEAIQAREELQPLTPEFLNLRLGAQEALSAAERAELQAVVDFNIAQATLTRLTGMSLITFGVDVTDDGDFVRNLSNAAAMPDVSPEGTAQPDVQKTVVPETMPANQ